MKGGELEGGLGQRKVRSLKKQRGEATQAQREKRRFVFAASLTPGRRRKGRASRASRGGEPRRRRVAQGQGACDSTGQFSGGGPRWAGAWSYAGARAASTGTCAGSAAVSGQSRRRHVPPLALWLLLAGTVLQGGLCACSGTWTAHTAWSLVATCHYHLKVEGLQSTSTSTNTIASTRTFYKCSVPCAGALFAPSSVSGAQSTPQMRPSRLTRAVQLLATASWPRGTRTRRALSPGTCVSLQDGMDSSVLSLIRSSDCFYVFGAYVHNPKSFLSLQSRALHPSSAYMYLQKYGTIPAATYLPMY